jgi:glycosyltransferase involved in cell wall biosynthesis
MSGQYRRLMKVGYFGTWESRYPRNEQVLASLRGAGLEVVEFHSDVWRDEHKFVLSPATLPRLARAEASLAFRRIPRDVDALLVGYPGQFDVPAAKTHGRPIVFNAMVSLYETLVDDRRRFRPSSLPARALHAIDRFAFRGADLLVSDTRANAAAMAELAGIEHVEWVFVGAEERLFKPTWVQPEVFTVLFVGKLIPLHGLATILEAARLLPEIPFRIVGSGQQDQDLERRPKNVEHVSWIDYDSLPAEYAAAGCALGIFGTSMKASRVIPNKVFQAIATGAPVITADTEGARELLANDRDALLVPPGDPVALADAIKSLREDPSRAARLGAAGRDTYEREATEAALGAKWRSLVESVL